MIRPNELRVGNYLLKYGKVVKVIDMGIKHHTDTNYYLRVDGDNSGYWIDQFSPIPLTEEILLKCGFDNTFHNKMCFYHKYLDLVIFLKSELRNLNYPYMDILRGKTIKVEYLHQLQNLIFALTGEELKIEL